MSGAPMVRRFGPWATIGMSLASAGAVVGAWHIATRA
jgi:hypothetical protein